ncbi:MAG: dockerin type I domain-containing protein, partial [candidate division Zixibacteria bacterium]|nr:dockerin type I domain-containing protein [candidate division Zixibacteria bacterium]
SGQFTDGGDFTETGLVRLIGLLVGDVNLDGQIDIADLIYLIDYQFQSGPAPMILAGADMDKSGFLDISDLLILIDYMFDR